MKWVVLCLAALWPLTGFAQDVGAQARAALADLDKAAASLADAQKKRDRVQALTQTVRAFEAGLGALREGLRQASIREEQLRRQLAVRDVEIGELLAALQTIRPGVSPEAFLHPKGISGAARAGMLLSEIVPALNQKAAQLRRDLEDVEEIGRLQNEAQAQLQTGLTELQQARIALSTAVADRTDLPQRFVTDADRMRTLVSAATSLDAFAAKVSTIATADKGWVSPPLPTSSLGLPVRGVVLRYSNEADAAGVERPGIVIATRAGALVTSPTAATIRYIGPLLDLGNVVILEPQADILFVFAGLETAYGKAGQIIAAGDPLGLMGGVQGELSTNTASTGSERGGVNRTETLYIEVRQNNVPQDPVLWFGTEKDG